MDALTRSDEDLLGLFGCHGMLPSTSPTSRRNRTPEQSPAHPPGDLAAIGSHEGGAVVARLRPTGSPVNLPTPFGFAAVSERWRRCPWLGPRSFQQPRLRGYITRDRVCPKLHLGYVNACNQIPSYGRRKP